MIDTIPYVHRPRFSDHQVLMSKKNSASDTECFKMSLFVTVSVLLSVNISRKSDTYLPT